MLGGLDWTGTALGQAFQSQEQVLFMFAAIVFIISVTLHMFSIPEQPFSPSNQVKDTENGDSTGQVSLKPAGRTLDVITEEDASARARSRDDPESDPKEVEIDFLAVERVRSKSDSVLAMPDATIELDADLDPDTQNFLPETHFQPEMQEELEDVFKLSDSSAEAPPSFGPQPPPDGMADMTPISSVLSELKDSANGHPSFQQTNWGSEDSQLKLVKWLLWSNMVFACFLAYGNFETNSVPSVICTTLPLSSVLAGQTCQWFWVPQCYENPWHQAGKPYIQYTARQTHLLQTSMV